MQESFSIKELSQLSRIKPHTLRIWEQRYGIMKPKRSDSNIRKYTGQDLKYLLNVSLLYDNGFKISNIARLSEDELNQEVRNLSTKSLSFPSQIQNLVIAMLELDEIRFENQLTSFVLSNGFEDTMKKLVFPFLHQVGMLWLTNSINPAQEHFITNLIRKKLFVAIDGICKSPTKETKKFILFLPEGELHEIGLLFCYYMIKNRGHQVIYLGQSLPLGDLEVIQNQNCADVIISILTSTPCGGDVQPYLLKLKKAAGKAKVFLSGYQVIEQPLNLPENFKIVLNPDHLTELLETDFKG